MVFSFSSLFMWSNTQKLGKFWEYQLGRQLKKHLLMSIRQIIIPTVHIERLSESATTYFVSHDKYDIRPPPTPNHHHSSAGINLHQENREKSMRQGKQGPLLILISKITLEWLYLLSGLGNYSKMNVGVAWSDRTFFVSLHVYLSMSESAQDSVPFLMHPRGSLDQRSFVPVRKFPRGLRLTQSSGNI